MIGCSSYGQGFGVTETLPEWSAGPEHYKTAKCLPGEQQLAAKLQHFVDSLQLLDVSVVFPKLVPNENLLKQEALQFCQGNRLCQLRAHFGETIANRILYLAFKFSVNASPLAAQNKDVQEWSNPEELDDVIWAFEALPEKLFWFESMKPVYRANTTVPGLHANALIALYPEWVSQDRIQRRMTLVHEFGHVAAELANTLDRSDEWLVLGSWVPTVLNPGLSEYRIQNDQSYFSSRYSKANPAEDFAEVFLQYRFNPIELKIRDSKKYEFMRNYAFDGAEYLSDYDCEKPSRHSKRLEAEILLLWQNRKKTNTHLDLALKAKVIRECSEVIFTLLERRMEGFAHSSTEFMQCARRVWVEENFKDRLAHGPLLRSKLWPALPQIQIKMRELEGILYADLAHGLQQTVLNDVASPEYAYQLFDVLSKKTEQKIFYKIINSSVTRNSVYLHATFFQKLREKYLSSDASKIGHQLAIEKWLEQNLSVDFQGLVESK